MIFRNVSSELERIKTIVLKNMSGIKSMVTSLFSCFFRIFERENNAIKISRIYMKKDMPSGVSKKR